MARRYFGTDGVRGVVGEFLTPELVERLGRAAATWTGASKVFVGRDTRASGVALEEAFGDAPDGENINVGCGATDLALLQRTVVDGGFDIGIAFDGDGDRMLAVDEQGEAIDGDQIIAILALDQQVDQVAVTVMTNLGFHALMREHGIRVHTTDVGDRYVLEALQREGGLLGGEQSGHVIYLRDHVTGDGLAAGLLLCGALGGTKLSQAAAVMARWPQAKENVP